MARKITPASIRFWTHVRGGDFTECWIWTAATRDNGYGAFGLSPSQSVSAHRFAYEDMVAPIPSGLQIDHLCRTRACVNPWHLEPVTADVNLKRTPNNQAHRTHCPEGHEYAGGNLYTYNGNRFCRACRNEAQKRYIRRKREGGRTP